MVFCTYQFLFAFLPMTMVGFWFLSVRGRVIHAKWWLVFCSMFFYAVGTGWFFLVYLASVMANYRLGLFLARRSGTCRSKAHDAGHGRSAKIEPTESTFDSGKTPKGFFSYFPRKIPGAVVSDRFPCDLPALTGKLLLGLGIAGNVLLLGYYKYTNFIVANLNALTGTDLTFEQVLLPIGISFFTFQLIAFLVDSHQGLTRDYNLLDYLLFITFFPQLIVGPIVHHGEMVPQYADPATYRLRWANFSRGLFLFSLGAAKKLILADMITPMNQAAFARVADLSLAECWAVALGFTVSLYFDMSGYADMALGLGRMFNIRLPINFNSPHRSRNYADYWQRWHLTLSRFLGDYVFRALYKKGSGSGRFYGAIFVTFMVSGFWHGAGWNYMVWGVSNALMVMVSYAMIRNNKCLPFALAWPITFSAVIMNRVIFGAHTLGDAWLILSGMFDPAGLDSPGIGIIGLRHPPLIALGLFLSIFFLNSNEMAERFRPDRTWAAATIFLLVISILSMAGAHEFIYFRF